MQADVDREAEGWAKHWNVGAPYNVDFGNIDPLDAPPDAEVAAPCGPMRPALPQHARR